MTVKMAKAVFREDFRWSRPKSPLSWEIKASPEPQSYPHDVVEAAVEAGKAKRVRPKRAAAKK